MNNQDYYRLLGVSEEATDDEIRKAYRRKAMEYHPDHNHASGAEEMFVRVSEAYQYLTSHRRRRGFSDEEYRKNYQAWVDYRRAEARKKAEEYARASYAAFRKSPLYKSTSVIDGASVFLGLSLSLAVIIFALYGYSYRMVRATSPREEPSLSLLVITLVIGTSYLVISFIYLSAWIAQQKKKRNEKEKENKESV